MSRRRQANPVIAFDPTNGLRSGGSPPNDHRYYDDHEDNEDGTTSVQAAPNRPHEPSREENHIVMDGQCTSQQPSPLAMDMAYSLVIPARQGGNQVHQPSPR